VKSKRTKRFQTLFAALPEEVQEQANRAYRPFTVDPSHPGLEFKQVHSQEPTCSARIGLHYPALAIKRANYWLWFWIGSHAEYDQILKQIR
jgi:hypothetical protein